MERKLAEPTFFDIAAADLGGPRTQAFFDKCDRLVPWQELAASLKGLYGDHAEGGRPPWPVILMVKCLMLQKWFGLSDPQLEEMLKDRLSFRRFVGLGLNDRTPDETTFVRFRARLRESGQGRTLFDEVVRQLEAKGVVMKNGTLVDATIIEAPLGRTGKDGTLTRDQDASHTYKHKRPYHGYKGHIATDKQGIIKDYRFGTASEHDSKYFDELTQDERTAVYGDSAYRGREREEELENRGIFNGIMYGRVKGQGDLPPAWRRRNRKLAKVRAIVEHPFAWMKNMGYRRTRYRGLIRNAIDFALTAAAYNLKRSFSLLECA